MDTKTIQRLTKKFKSKVLIGLGSKNYFDNKTKPFIIEMDWNGAFSFKNLSLSFLPSKHWSKRGVRDTNQSLWGAFAIQGKHKVYFAGDTGYGSHFKTTQEKYDSFDLSLIPIGAYEPRWFMKESHMNPAEAVKAHMDLKSKNSIGIHHGTFKLTNEGINEPAADLLKALAENNINNDKFKVLKQGETLKVF